MSNRCYNLFTSTNKNISGSSSVHGFITLSANQLLFKHTYLNIRNCLQLTRWVFNIRATNNLWTNNNNINNHNVAPFLNSVYKVTDWNIIIYLLLRNVIFSGWIVRLDKGMNRSFHWDTRMSWCLVNKHIVYLKLCHSIQFLLKHI